MFKIENKVIHLTRGDIACIEAKALNEDGTDYTFQVGDIVRLNVFKRKDCGCVELQKDTEVKEAGSSVDIHLTSEDTKIGGIINKPTIYWYEIVLNPDTNPQTIIGYDKEGEKQFILYPEASDNE
jgi:hypothetical protein